MSLSINILVLMLGWLMVIDEVFDIDYGKALSYKLRGYVHHIVSPDNDTVKLTYNFSFT